MPAVSARSGGFVGKVKDLTGPGITDHLGAMCTDLGASVLAADGNLVSVFGDTFSGNRVGVGDWRSPVILIGHGDATHPIVYRTAGGGDARYARQLWHYRHRPNPGLLRRGISTVIPSDLLRVDDTLYLHAIVNRGFGNVVWTEIWRSDDNGRSWRNLGDRSKYLGWGHGRWGKEATVITPDGETWGELTLRRLDCGTWVLGGFLSSSYALGYRTIATPTADLADVPIQRPVLGCEWANEDHDGCQVAQLYGGYILPGSRLNVTGGVGLVVSQWNTARGWPYRVMQFRVTLEGI